MATILGSLNASARPGRARPHGSRTVSQPLCAPMLPRVLGSGTSSRLVGSCRPAAAKGGVTVTELSNGELFFQFDADSQTPKAVSKAAMGQQATSREEPAAASNTEMPLEKESTEQHELKTEAKVEEAETAKMAAAEVAAAAKAAAAEEAASAKAVAAEEAAAAAEAAAKAAAAEEAAAAKAVAAEEAAAAAEAAQRALEHERSMKHLAFLARCTVEDFEAAAEDDYFTEEEIKTLEEAAADAVSRLEAAQQLNQQIRHAM